MWVIVEGCTVAGKSTIVKELEPLMKDRYVNRVHMDRPKELTRRWALKEYALHWEAVNPSTTHILADRWHWGEATYSPIYRPTTNKDGFGLLGVAGWRFVELFLLSRGAITIQVRAESPELIKRLNQRGDDHVLSEEDLLRVAHLYEKTTPLAPSLATIYNTTRDNSGMMKNFTEMVIRSAEVAERSVAPLRNWPGYIGRPAPKALLVGDTRNVTQEHGEETILPFMPVNGNSGDFLLRALPAGLWSNVGIVNSAEYGSTFDDLWQQLGRPKVIALGRNARSILERAHVPIAVTVPHPQYVRRFRTNELAEYGEAIECAVATGGAPLSWKL